MTNKNMASRSLLLVATVVVAIFMMVTEAQGTGYYDFVTVDGYFLQDDPTTNPATFDYVRYKLIV
jgi:hypothetical protein